MKKSENKIIASGGALRLLLALSLILPPNVYAKKQSSQNIKKLMPKSQSRWQVMAIFQTDPELLALENKNKLHEHLEQEFLLQRNVQMNGHDIPMGTVTQYLFRRDKKTLLTPAQAMKEAKKLAEDLRRSVKGPEWEVEKKSSSQIQFVADWPQLNRFVRIVYKDLGTHYAISLASARRAFLVPVFTESILVQDGLINKLQSSSTAHSAPPFPILELFKIPEAQAQNLTNWNSLLDQYLKNPNINKDVSKIKTDFGSGSTDVNHFINQFHNDGNGNFSLKTSADVAVSANLNANLNATANVGDSTLKAVDGTLNQNVAAPVNHLANSITGAGNQGLAAATKLGDSITSAANTLTSPKNALLMSLAGGIGFFGSQAILHFAADGTIRVIEGLYHNIMGTLTDSEKNKMTELFGKAFQDFDHSSAEMNDIEHSLDEQFAAMAIATNEDPESLAKRFNSKDKIDLLSDLDKQRLRANSSFRVAEKNLDEIGARQGMTCPNYENALNNLVGIDNQAKSLNFLYDSLKKVGGDYSLLCQNIQNSFDRWVRAEYSFYLAKNQMLVNFQAHINEIVGKVLDSNQSVGSQRKANNFCNEQIKALSEERQRVSQPDPNCVSQEKNLLAKDPSYTTDLNQVAKQNCMQLSQERMIENINSMADSCRDISSVQSQLQNSQYLDVAIQMARANVNIAKNFFNQLAHQDCRSGVQTALCDGKSDGDFTALEKRYEAKFAQAQKYCPNLKSNKQSYLDNLRKNPGEVSHSALASSNNENAVKPEVQCNIFCRMYNKIASIFRS